MSNRFLIIILLIMSYPSSAFECVIKTKQQHYQKADLVFSGEVKSISKFTIDRFLKVTFKNIELIKGKFKKSKFVITNDKDELFGYSFLLGKTYTVYAETKFDEFYTSSCSYTKIHLKD